jgi:hypothetical protein
VAGDALPRSEPGRNLPWYIGVLDVLAAGLAVVLVSTLAFGPLRVHFDTLRVSVQSPLRPLILLIVAVLLRHALVSRPHLLARLGRWWWGWRQDPAVRHAAAAMLSVRLPVLVAAYFAVLILGYPGGQPPPFRVSRNEVVNLPARWDAGWYLNIAVDGYWPDRRSDVQQNIAFFPAYPVLTRIGGTLLGARPIIDEKQSVNMVEVDRRLNERTLLAGWMISLGATFLALVYLFRFARDTLGGDAPAGAVLLISAYPFAYFFGAAYTEGLFLLGSVATLYHFRRGEYLAATGWGLLLGLTRPNGCLLSVPLGVMALQQSFFPMTLSAGDPGPRPGWRECAKGLVVAAMPGIGMLTYSWWLWTITGRPLAWMQAHGAWGRTFQSVGELVGERVESIGELGLYGYSASQPIEMLYVACVVLCLLALWPVARRLGWAYAVLMLVTVVPPLSAGGFLSMGRITSTLFPVFVYLGWRLPPARQAQVAFFCTALQGMLAALFFTWRPVF